MSDRERPSKIDQLVYESDSCRLAVAGTSLSQDHSVMHEHLDVAVVVAARIEGVVEGRREYLNDDVRAPNRNELSARDVARKTAEGNVRTIDATVIIDDPPVRIRQGVAV